jgi:RNA-binding proteins (RRM domain)
MNIYVSNLNFSTTSESLQELFTAYGEVESTKIVTDRETWKSRGFGFVEMPNDAEGQKAIDVSCPKKLYRFINCPEWTLQFFDIVLK